jgi:hypothetical protein
MISPAAGGRQYLANQMEVGKAPRKQKTPQKQGFNGSQQVTLPTLIASELLSIMRLTLGERQNPDRKKFRKFL